MPSYTETLLERHARYERYYSMHLNGVTEAEHDRVVPHDQPCSARELRNKAYEAYTGKPHPSTLKGGSQ